MLLAAPPSVMIPVRLSVISEGMASLIATSSLQGEDTRLAPTSMQ